MKHKISNQFLSHYLIVFLLSLLALAAAFFLFAFADSFVSGTLMKNTYPASVLMRDDYTQIDTNAVVRNGGGVQVVDRDYRVVFSAGLDTIGKQQLSVSEFTDFLTRSRSAEQPYHYDVLYNPDGAFWLIVTFPTSIRLHLSVVYNREAVSADMGRVALVILGILLCYLLLLALLALIFSRITAARITRPLRKLCEGTRLLREGDYSARVDLHLKNEFLELQDTFNEMATRIESETLLRKQSEDDRRTLILDVSHDLKNPLAIISGYAERCLSRDELSPEERSGYLQIIHQNSKKANRLLTQLFELSRLESPGFALQPTKTEVCEYLRQACGELLPLLDEAGFIYTFDIPEGPYYALLDAGQMSRVFGNLTDNTVRYNPRGTAVSVSLSVRETELVIVFRDDGGGMPGEAAAHIFEPFFRVDAARNSDAGGTGLGLSIVQKIVEAHGGKITLRTAPGAGCAFTILLSRI